VIRDTGDRSTDGRWDNHLLPPQNGDGKKKESGTRRCLSIITLAMAYSSACLSGRAARDDILKIRERAARRGDLFRKHAELYASDKT